VSAAAAMAGEGDAGTSLSRAYARLLLAYLVALLYCYPYGISLGGDASVRVPDILGVLCLVAGLCALVLQGRLRVDLLFLAVAGPFLLLELVTPVLGAVAYRKPLDAVSSLRMALLWLPMILLTMLSNPAAEPGFTRRLRVVLVVSVFLNVAYGLVQVAVDFGYAPAWLAFTRLLEPWAVDRHFDVVLGLRPAGFFVNTTALSVFGIVCLAYFYAQYIANRQREDLWLSLLSFFLVVLTTSRVAFAAAVLIVATGWFALTGRRKVVVLVLTAAAAIAVLAAIESTIGIDQVFYRFTRLAEAGLLADVSFGGRVNETWPAALAAAREYPFGSLTSAPRIATLIDSGYLNYYIQGRWVFVAALALMLAGQLALGLRQLRRPFQSPGALILLFMTVYLALGLVVTNPARSPIVIAVIVYAYWVFKTERDGFLVRMRPPREPGA
jgi:hypothetical protein